MQPSSDSVRNVEDPSPHGFLQMSYGQDTESELGTPMWLSPSLLPTVSAQGHPLIQDFTAAQKLTGKPALMPVLQGTLTSGDQHSTQAAEG